MSDAIRLASKSRIKTVSGCPGAATRCSNSVQHSTDPNSKKTLFERACRCAYLKSSDWHFVTKTSVIKISPSFPSLDAQYR